MLPSVQFLPAYSRLIQATYVDETSKPTPVRTLELKGLKPHLEQFGLLRTERTDANFPKSIRLALFGPSQFSLAFCFYAFAKARNAWL